MKIIALNHTISKLSLGFVGFYLLFLVQSCNGLSVTSTPTPVPQPTPTEEPVASDCRWIATGKSWNDDNQNGVWDAGEQPLANVNIWVDDTLNGYQKVNEDLANTVASDADGNVEIAVWLPGCPDVKFEVYTEAARNCKLTTPERIPVNMEQRDPVYSFGFVCQ